MAGQAKRNRATNTPAVRVWHYTVGMRLSKIIASGEIRLSTAYLQPGEKAAVYFSTNPQWEETANKGVFERGKNRRLTREETHALAGGLARIEVRPDAARYTWQSFKRFGVLPSQATSLEKAAREWGADPTEWRISLCPVPQTAWLSVEIWDGEQWAPFPGYNAGCALAQSQTIHTQERGQS